MASKKLFWRIQIFDGTNIKYSRDIPQWQIGSKRILDILRTLVAKAALTDDEIIYSLSNRNSPSYREHLKVNTSSSGLIAIRCGSNPHGLISVVNCDGQQFIPDNIS